MGNLEGAVSTTADALSVLRADQDLMRTVGAQDPYAHYFVSDEGERLVSLATQIDPVVRPFSAARYRWFSDRIEDAVKAYAQVIVLGAGFDTRAIWMSAFHPGGCMVFEVDRSEMLATKYAVLRDHGVAKPDWVASVGADLASDDVGAALVKAGWDTKIKTFVMAEGVVFFLPAQAVSNLLSPTKLGLVEGSKVALDFWTRARLERLNRRMFELRGMELFKKFPAGDQLSDVISTLKEMGYSTANIMPLIDYAQNFWPDSETWKEADGWALIEMQVGNLRPLRRRDGGAGA
ncbi:class I SAM-dependent methyltransferase [Methylocapsa sp. S129]|uniref:class I SAM-dependent methyltransferase n=1 Tax=Methylocapsa sp. S129 TaxID=1641869 RepID=UPI00131C3346|nr:class I SAM-dependent methyltransferase [Methylocapsa sp. S129]